MKTGITLLTLSILLTTTAFSQRSDKVEGVKLKLHAIEIAGDTLLLHLNLKNRSLVSYHWNELRVFAKDRHVTKRTAVQETDLNPLLPFDLPTLPANGDTSLCVTYEAFAIPHTKVFTVQAAESTGSRVLTLRVTGRRFMRLLKKRKSINQFQ